MQRKAKNRSRLYTRGLANRQHWLNRQCYGWWLDVPHLSGSRTWYDLMGLTHGTLQSFAVKSWGVLSRPGGFGSLMFDASSYVDYGASDTRYNFTSEYFTFAFWVYANTLTNSPIPINRGTYATNGWYVYLASSGAVELQCEATGVDNAITTGSSVAVTNTWQHFILTRTGTSTGAIYLNGRVVSTSGALGNCTSSTNPLQIGQYNGGSNRLNGYMDDVRIYGRGFSASEALWLYNLSLLGYPGVLNRATSPLLGPIGGTAWTKTCAETLTLTDARLMGIAKALVETYSLNDARSMGAARLLAETLSLTDTRTMGAGKVGIEAYTLTDLKKFAIGKVAQEALNLTDARLMGLSKRLAETYNLTDTAAAAIVQAAVLIIVNVGPAGFDTISIGEGGIA